MQEQIFKTEVEKDWTIAVERVANSRAHKVVFKYQSRPAKKVGIINSVSQKRLSSNIMSCSGSKKMLTSRRANIHR